MKIALGKFYSDLSKKQDFTQIINVKNVIIHPLYQDQSGNYGSDIAVLELEHNAELSQFVAPICLDWTRHDMDKHLTEGSIGLVRSHILYTVFSIKLMTFILDRWNGCK